MFITIFGIIFKVRFRKAKIVRNLFQKVLFLMKKAPKVGVFHKKHLENKLHVKILEIIVEIPKAYYFSHFFLTMGVCIINVSGYTETLRKYEIGLYGYLKKFTVFKTVY